MLIACTTSNRDPVNIVNLSSEDDVVSEYDTIPRVFGRMGKRYIDFLKSIPRAMLGGLPTMRSIRVMRSQPTRRLFPISLWRIKYGKIRNSSFGVVFRSKLEEKSGVMFLRGVWILPLAQALRKCYTINTQQVQIAFFFFFASHINGFASILYMGIGVELIPEL